MASGYAVATWFWEGVVALRKAAIVFIIIFIDDTILRTYLSMWVLTLALGVHIVFQPFDPARPSLYYLEGLGITTLVLTLNLSLLFQFDFFGDGTAQFNALVVFLFAINVLVCVIFIILIAIQIALRIRAAFRKQQDTEGEQAAIPEEQAPEVRKASILPPEEGDDGFGDLRKIPSLGQDRFAVQRDGIMGALRRMASKGPHKMYAQRPSLPATNPATLQFNAGETPFERVKRLESRA